MERGVQFFTSPFLGNLSDSVGRRVVLLASLSLHLASLVLVTIVPNRNSVLCYFIVNGACLKGKAGPVSSSDSKAHLTKPTLTINHSPSNTTRRLQRYVGHDECNGGGPVHGSGQDGRGGDGPAVRQARCVRLVSQSGGRLCDV